MQKFLGGKPRNVQKAGVLPAYSGFKDEVITIKAIDESNSNTLTNFTTKKITIKAKIQNDCSAHKEGTMPHYQCVYNQDIIPSGQNEHDASLLSGYLH